jgi:hypothetical protein
LLSPSWSGFSTVQRESETSLSRVKSSLNPARPVQPVGISRCFRAAAFFVRTPRLTRYQHFNVMGNTITLFRASITRPRKFQFRAARIFISKSISVAVLTIRSAFPCCLQVIPIPGLVQHSIVWRLSSLGGISFARRATRILNTLGACLNVMLVVTFYLVAHQSAGKKLRKCHSYLLLKHGIFTSRP